VGTARGTRGVVALALLAAVVAPATAGEGDDAEKPWVVHTGAGWAVAAPQGWRVLKAGLRPPMVLHLTGDGIGGLPRVDGVLAPLQVGLSVDCYPQGGPAPQAVLDSILESAKGTPTRRTRTPLPIVPKDVTLADGTKAQLLIAEVDKVEGPRTRLAVYTKLVAATKNGQTVVVSSWVVGSHASAPFFKASGIARFVEAHVLSLVLAEDQLDGAALLAAHKEIKAARLVQAIAEAGKGNAAIGRDPAAAIAAFERSLDLFEHLSAAQNGLAWVLLTSPDPNLLDLPRALELAKQAVANTDRRDPDSLDTLARAFHMSGSKAEAVAAIQEAIELSPDDPGLKETLERYRGGGE